MVARVNLVQSGFQDSSKFPYVTLSKVANSLDTRDTCANRIERNIFQITAYDDDFSNLDDILEKIHSFADTGKLKIGNRRFLSMLFNEKNVTEEASGIYRGFLQYEILTQKDFTPNLYNIEISGSLFSSLLGNLVQNITTTRYGNEGWDRPFLFIPGYETVEAFLYTCLTRIEATRFEIAVEEYNPDIIEDILEEIDNLLSYSRLTIENRRFTSMEWLGDSLIEIEAGIWRGAIQYEILLEKTL